MATCAEAGLASNRESSSSWEDYADSDRSVSPQTTPRSHSREAALHSSWSASTTSSPASLSSTLLQSITTDKTPVSPDPSQDSFEHDTEDYDFHALKLSKLAPLPKANTGKEANELSDESWEMNTPSPRPRLTRPWTTVNQRATSQSPRESPRGAERSLSFCGGEKETWDDDFASDAVLRPNEVILAHGHQVRQNLGKVREFVRLVDRLADVHASGAARGVLHTQPSLWREAEAIIALSREEASDPLVAQSGILGSVGEAEGSKTRIDATMLPALVDKVSELIRQLEQVML